MSSGRFDQVGSGRAWAEDESGVVEDTKIILSRLPLYKKSIVNLRITYSIDVLPGSDTLRKKMWWRTSTTHE